MNRKKEGYTRISISIIMFVLACFMPNLWSITLISIVGLYALITGVLRIKA